MEIKVKKLDDRAKLPKQGSPCAAGYDLYALEDAIIKGGQTTPIHTGIALEIPDGYYGGIYARSGLATKQGLAPVNCVGIIDSDYRGEIIVALHNCNPPISMGVFHVSSLVCEMKPFLDENSDKRINAGDRIAQLIIHKCEDVAFIESDELSSTDRGEGGFGSTGSK